LIYQVNAYNDVPTYFDDANASNAKTEAEALLTQRRAQILIQEAGRFSVCATFVSGNDTVWRNLNDEDPEDTVCQVFDHVLGEYEEIQGKTLAYQLNEERKEEFLASIKLDKVYEYAVMPSDQSVSIGLNNV
jgi:hypothetical protein